MVFCVLLFGLVILFFGNPAVATCIDYERTEACDAVFSPDAMEVTCCAPMKEFVDILNKCKRESYTDELTCEVALCVAETYGSLTDNEIDECKVRAILKKLNKENPAAKPLNDEIEKNCLNGQYKQYVTSDPDCDAMKFQVCAYVNSLMGCRKFMKSRCYCNTLSENVATCKPYLQQYLDQISPSRCYVEY